MAIRIRTNEGALLNVQHISGEFNAMADVASRRHTTNPNDFLNLFSATFPPPQAERWILYLPSNTLKSRLFSELRHQPSPLAWWQRLRVRDGIFGSSGNAGFTRISRQHLLNCGTSSPQSNSKFWLPTPTMCAPAAFRTANQRFAPKLSRWHSAPSPRPSNWMENKAPWDHRKKATQRKSNNFWKAINAKTHLQNHD